MHTDLGPLCIRGHERAVYERFYPRAGMRTGARRCMACQHDLARNKRQTKRLDAEMAARNRTTTPDDLLWATFCRTIVGRIEAVRRDEAMRETIERRRSA